MATVPKLDDSPYWYDDQVSLMSDMESPRTIPIHPNYHTQHNFHHHNMYHCKQELEVPYNISHHDPFLQLPHLESPKMPYGPSSSSLSHGHRHMIQPQPLNSMYGMNDNAPSDQVMEQVTTDWRALDKFVASQLSHGDHDSPSHTSKESNYGNVPMFPVYEHMSMVLSSNSTKQQDIEPELEYGSTSTSGFQVDPWK